jgi:hypothetical protein
VLAIGALFAKLNRLLAIGFVFHGRPWPAGLKLWLHLGTIRGTIMDSRPPSHAWMK